MKSTNNSRALRSQTGLSMIELLVALAIGSFLIIGAVTLQSQTRRTFDVNEQQARLQENARFVLALMEPDLQLAGLYGYSQDPNTVMWQNGSDLTPASDLRMTSATAPGLPGSVRSCGDNFAVDVLGTVVATDGVYTLDCAAEGGGHVVGTDVIVMRHSAPGRVDPDPSKLQVFSERVSAQTNTRLFIGSDPPEPIVDEQREVRDMVVKAYYIATNADAKLNVPTLRVKTLATDGASPVFIDQELIPGVEDIQVQFGVDPGDDTDGNGIPDDPGGDGMADFVNGYAAQYVSAGDPLLDSAQVVAVRVWIRVRSELPERGFVDGRRYEYAGVDFTPNDNFRRVLMSRTIYLRNSRQQ